ncbi:DUF4238 domain-containing protein [Aeromonas hydrophila]
MKKSSQPRYQHYIPKAYLRGFRTTENKNEDNCYVFYKNKDEDKFINGKLTPANTKKNFKSIFTEQHRHTLNVENQKDFMIEEFFCKMESLYPKFISAILEYTLEKNSINGKIYSGFYDLSEPEVSKLIRIMITFLIYRLKYFDNSLKREKSFSSSIIKSEIDQAVGMTAMVFDVPEAEIINPNDWVDFSLDMDAIGFTLNYADREYISEIKNAYNKIYRFIFQWINQLTPKKQFKPYIFLAPEVHQFISSDVPFLIDTSGENDAIVFPIAKCGAIFINFEIEK